MELVISKRVLMCLTQVNQDSGLALRLPMIPLIRVILPRFLPRGETRDSRHLRVWVVGACDPLRLRTMSWLRASSGLE